MVSVGILLLLLNCKYSLVATLLFIKANRLFYSIHYIIVKQIDRIEKDIYQKTCIKMLVQ